MTIRPSPLPKSTTTLSWILFAEFASPLVIQSGKSAQLIAPQGDGWVRSFEAKSGNLLWKFDINPKTAKRKHERNFFLNSPVVHKGRVYLAAGQDVESGQGPGRLVCLDPTLRGDISLEIETSPGRRMPNPNSGAFWHFDELGRSLSNVAIHKGLVIAVDLSGYVYCLDAATGRKHWKHDAGAHVWASPLIADGKIYIATEDGDLLIFALANKEKLIAKHQFDSPIYSSPIFANGVLYIATGGFLYAIQSPRSL